MTTATTTADSATQTASGQPVSRGEALLRVDTCRWCSVQLQVLLLLTARGDGRPEVRCRPCAARARRRRRWRRTRVPGRGGSAGGFHGAGRRAAPAAQPGRPHPGENPRAAGGGRSDGHPGVSVAGGVTPGWRRRAWTRGGGGSPWGARPLSAGRGRCPRLTASTTGWWRFTEVSASC